MKSMTKAGIWVLAVTAVGLTAPASVARAGTVLAAPTVPTPIVVDGDASDWGSLPSIAIPLEGKSGVAAVRMRAAVHDETIYMLVVWADPTENVLHKPFRWSEGEQRYKRTNEMEDRFAISFPISGDFSHDKTDGSEFTADVWHWKASRSNPAGLAHDKIWKVTKDPHGEKAKEFETPAGKIYLSRRSDQGDRLYKPTRHDSKDQDVMPRYVVNTAAKGSIADVKAKGVWRDGRWVLEMARKLDTGHADDVRIPENGQIKMAVAAFDGLDSKDHSVSGIIILSTGNVAMKVTQ